MEPITHSTTPIPLGYCTNVHAGSNLAEAKVNLANHAVAVHQKLGGVGKLPVGLWLSEIAANDLLHGHALHDFREWLEQHALLPYTFNGFPQGDFHQPVVKHRVYEPTWSCHSRAAYSMTLARILDVLLPASANGSISTLPIGWPHCPWHAEDYHTAADNLIEVARFLDQIAQQRGREIVLAIEPEPGCILNTAQEVVDFFEHYLFSGPEAALARQYLTVCHDVCHSGVMFESQEDALTLYREHGVRVGKVQLSSAVHVPWDSVLDNPNAQEQVLEQLRGFNEPRYLHQTTVCGNDHRLDRICEDLSVALRDWMDVRKYPTRAWRVHFHVPIFVERFDHLQTTQSDIDRAITYLEANKSLSVAGRDWFTGHYEVETYAWPVLPAALQASDLASGIAHEIAFAAKLLAQHAST